jgi:hypothetical protein
MAVTPIGSSVMLWTDHLVVYVPAGTSRAMCLIKLKLNINFSWTQVYQGNFETKNKCPNRPKEWRSEEQKLYQGWVTKFHFKIVECLPTRTFNVR